MQLEGSNKLQNLIIKGIYSRKHLIYLLKIMNKLKLTNILNSFLTIKILDNKQQLKFFIKLIILLRHFLDLEKLQIVLNFSTNFNGLL
jgi:hypothetical protein